MNVIGKSQHVAPTELVAVATELSPTEPAIVVAEAMSDAVDARTRALIEEFVAEAGAPPAEFTWLALGSHARRELHCASDQDHALVWTSEDAAASRYALDLADHVIGGLRRFGMRPCSGGYMADRWSHSLRDWDGIIAERIAAPTPDAVLDADIFLDLRPVAGTVDTTGLTATLRRGAQSRRLLHGLAQAANSFGVPLTALGRLPRGSIDVKKSGLAPIVLLARLYGLVAGSDATGTRDRLGAAAGAGILSEKLAGRLDFAYTFLTRVRMHSQLRQIAAGDELSDTLTIDAIPWQDQGLLRTALRSVRSAQGTTAVTYRTDL